MQYRETGSDILRTSEASHQDYHLRPEVEELGFREVKYVRIATFD